MSQSAAAALSPYASSSPSSGHFSTSSSRASIARYFDREPITTVVADARQPGRSALPAGPVPPDPDAHDAAQPVHIAVAPRTPQVPATVAGHGSARRQEDRDHRRADRRVARVRRRPHRARRGRRDRAHRRRPGAQPHPAHGPQARRRHRRVRARRHRARPRRSRSATPLATQVGPRRRRAARDRVRARGRASATTSWRPRGTTSPWRCTSRPTR